MPVLVEGNVRQGILDKSPAHAACLFVLCQQFPLRLHNPVLIKIVFRAKNTPRFRLTLIHISMPPSSMYSVMVGYSLNCIEKDFPFPRFVSSTVPAFNFLTVQMPDGYLTA